KLLFQVVRYEPKDFRQRQPDGTGWIWNLKGVRRVVFQLPALVAAVAADQMIWFVEGEKDVEALRKLGFAATTNPGGARKWRKDYAAFLRGARVVLLPDNDEAGRDHMARIAEGLAGIARDVHTVDLRTIWPECPHKGDVSDYVAAGGT